MSRPQEGGGEGGGDRNAHYISLYLPLQQCVPVGQIEEPRRLYFPRLKTASIFSIHFDLGKNLGNIKSHLYWG